MNILFLFLRFDNKDNNVGVLSTKLAVEAAAVQGVFKFFFLIHIFKKYFIYLN
jgi:hypothetical protein